MPEGGRAGGGEPDVAERDLARDPGEERERQEQDHEDQGSAVGRKSAPNQDRERHQPHRAQHRAAHDDPGRQPSRPGHRPLLAAGALGQEPGRGEQHDDDEHQEGDDGRDAVERRVG